MICRLLAAVLGLYLLAVMPMPAQAAENDGKPAAEDIAKAVDPFAVPEGTNEELLAFIDTMRTKRPQGNSREAMIAGFTKSRNAMNAAAEKILANHPDAKAKSAAIEAKLESLAGLTGVDAPGSQDALFKLATEVEAAGDEALAKKAQSLLMQLRLRKVMSGNVDDAKQLLDEVMAQLKTDPNDASAVRLAMGLGQALEYSDHAELAARAYRQFADVLAKSTDPGIQQQTEKLEGILRRLELPGHPMEISGTLLDGKAFDPKTLAGKVVLVDFWATWCGPCVGELPNVVENYKKYHDKGFEVIGISLDDDREALEKFVIDRELPWPILFEDAEGSRGWKNPLAIRYGVGSIPTVILIGADGNVVSLHARGEKLGELLEKQLGPVSEDSADEASKAKKSDE